MTNAANDHAQNNSAAGRPGAFLTAFGALPAVQLRTPSGAEAVVTLFGAQLVSWRPRPDDERVFCSALSALDGTRAIRGGVPVIFPQFAERGDGMRHGFARLANWRLLATRVDGDSAIVECGLTHDDLTHEQARTWPHPFALHLTITLRAGDIDLDFEVRNTGATACAFSAALHTYFRVAELSKTTLTGVHGLDYTDPLNAGGVRDEEPMLVIADKLDRIYRGIDGALTLRDGVRGLRLEQQGYRDAVVWNPGALDARAMADMADEEFREFVCVEAALIAPQTLQPGAAWRASQRWTIVE